MDNILLKPAQLAAGGVALVRDPLTGVPLAVEGEWKVRSQYWNRRLRDGDVVEVQPSSIVTAVQQSLQSAAIAGCGTCPEPEACEKTGRCARDSAPL
ncbi:DUF2635 domain-containing protein [Bradyrhizobium sp. SZCCHNR1075]|uniref:DUF2635 domain-containing protein n=1 Tax=Bradyrhizobium sp. SZCCHNR1075 TaxID=3057362 RepID=UPI0028EDD167|nr:DUF2635 domain-containing protein [Bradyrhizobium sp. SZCCHNR1075]